MKTKTIGASLPSVLGIAILALLAGVFCFSSDVQAITTPQIPDTVIESPNAGYGSEDFGNHLSVNGDLAVVSRTTLIPSTSIWDSPVHYFIYKREGDAWGLDAEDKYGASTLVSLEVNGDTYGDIFPTGVSTSKMVKGTWLDNHYIRPDDVGDPVDFKSLSIDGNTILIGASATSGGNSLVYVLTRELYESVHGTMGTEWELKARLTVSDGSEWLGFGSSLSLSEPYAIIGTDAGRGKAYIFKHEGEEWLLQTELSSFGGDPDLNFGSQVEIDGDLAAVKGLGKVYTYRLVNGQWQELAVITSPDPVYGASSTRFGGAEQDYGLHGKIALDDGYLAVGEYIYPDPYDPLTSPRSGRVYLFKLEDDAWVEQTSVRGCAYCYDDNFGAGYDISDGTLLVNGISGGIEAVFSYSTDPESQPDPGASGLPAFDKNWYLQTKLEHQQSVTSGWEDVTISEYETYLKGEGYTAQSHYSRWGYMEGLSPNPYFNPSEYTIALSRYLVQQGIYPSVQDAMDGVEASWSGDVYLHYLAWGAAAGINPSNSFDASRYLEDKLTALQAAGKWAGKTTDDLGAELSDLGKSALEDHFIEGTGMGIVPVEVPEEEKADICATDLPFDSVNGVPGFDKAWYLSAKLAHQQAAGPGWGDKTTEEYECFLRKSGYSAASHYSTWGYTEGLEPNAWFSHADYLEIISKRLVDLGAYTNIEDAEASVRAAWPGDLYQHYLAWGARDGLDPSYSFDESQYLSDRLSLLQAGGEWTGKTVEDLRAYFAAQGTTVLEDYLENGAALGLTPASVPEDERASDAI